jgi:6-hydroxycyclohex-1-ene-1-carbonyl-CoA dehydrogenase
MTGPGRLERFERSADRPGEGRALVEVAGCGVCHTDLGFLYDGVPTKHALPLVLGHEIAGVVVDAGGSAESLIGRRVLVPAVSPCGACRACRAGRGTACRTSLMPGNDEDGGFASHVEVPARTLCPVDREAGVAAGAPVGAAQLALWEVAVVADAVTTPLQAIKRCGLGPSEFAIVVGVGGVGSYGVQLARAVGATVAAIDVDPAKLALATSLGASLAIDGTKEPKAIRAALRELAAARGLSPDGWRVFEMSGTVKGQELAFSLLTPGGSISVVGFSPSAGSFRLSNLMAFDATAYGNWGCDPSLYPAALEAVASGSIRVRELVRKERLEDAPAVIEAVHRRAYVERVVLVP